VQAYGGSYSFVTSSGNIHNEIGVMRISRNEIAMSDSFKKQILAPTHCSKRCSFERLIIGDMCIYDGQDGQIQASLMQECRVL